MFPSQASYTFNPFLPFTASISIPTLPSDALTSFAGSPILQCVTDFISSSHSSCTTLSKPTLTLNSSSTDDLKTNERTIINILYHSLEDAVRRVLGAYHRLSALGDATRTRTTQERFDFSQKVLIVAENNQFKWHAINLLFRLATLVREYPQESLLKHAHTLYRAFSSSTQLSNSLKQHKSSDVHQLLAMLFNMPISHENSIYSDYIKDCKHKKNVKVEEQEKPVKLQSPKCYNVNGVVCGTSSTLMDMLMAKKTAVCSEEDLEEESERLERSSTTSASSRTIAGEVELPLTYNCFNSFPQTNKVSPTPKEKELHEIYDGCFFGDLTITFKPIDKILLQCDEGEERRTHRNQAWPRASYNKHHFSKVSPFNVNQNLHSNFNQRPEDQAWKANPIPIVDPSSTLKTPPTMDQKVITLNLFTLPQGTLLPTTPFNAFNPLNLTVPGQIQQVAPLPFNNMMNPMNPVTQVIPQVVQPEKPLVNQKPRDINKGAEVKDGKKQQKGQNTVPATNKGMDSVSAPKNTQGQVNNSGSAVKKPNSQKSKKTQDKGGFKLWDMISVKGKLKQ